MSTERNEHIGNVLKPAVLAKIMPAIETGINVGLAHIKSNEDFYNDIELSSKVKTRTLTYAIEKQMRKEATLGNFPFGVYVEKVGYNWPIIILTVQDISITLLRTRKRREIGNQDIAYLRKKCVGNNILDKQLTMFEQDEIKDFHLHGVLLYDFDKRDGQIRFADILFYKDDLRNFYHPIDLKSVFSSYVNSDEEEEQKLLGEENLKKGAQKEKIR